MTEIIGIILPYIPNAALPIVICFCFYMYIQGKRKTTKQERDDDSRNIHDTLLKHDFTIGQLKDSQSLIATVQEDIRAELGILNTNVAKLGVVVENLSETVKEMRRNEDRE